jgi:hypothetical protein
MAEFTPPGRQAQQAGAQQKVEDEEENEDGEVDQSGQRVELGLDAVAERAPGDRRQRRHDAQVVERDLEIVEAKDERDHEPSARPPRPPAAGNAARGYPFEA